MKDEIVKIKGSKNGLQMSFSPTASFPEIVQTIREKLSSGSAFFLKGTTVQIPREPFTDEERETLRKLFYSHGLICQSVRQQASNPQPASSNPAPAASNPQQPAENVQQMVVIDRTLRGGQEVRTQSSVLVCGNVNPGAQIIAGGSIDIRGTCRGIVHAGALGDTKAFIVADHLMPTQIRIANLIARSPDPTPAAAYAEKTKRAERASIKDGQIVIEPIER